MSLLKKHSLLQFLLVAVFNLFAFNAAAQSDPSGERRVTGTYVITNATVFTGTGPGATLDIIIKNGLIEAVGKNLKPPLDAQEIKGDSLFVYPGFIDVAGNAGVKTPATLERPSNMNPSDPPPHIAGITPYVDVLNSWEPSAEDLDTWRKTNITMVNLIPNGEGMLPGKTATVLAGHKGSSNILASSTGMFAKFEAIRGLYPGTTLGVMAKWRELYQNAELAEKHQSLFASNKGIVRPEKDLVLEAFFPVIDQAVPVIFKISDELELRRALTLQREKGFKAIITGVNEGASLIPAIKEAKAQVVLSANLPEDKASKKEIKGASEEVKANLERVQAAYKNSLELASVFEKEGIPFAFTTLDLQKGNFLKNIRLMVENGLSEEAALAALTINAARILGQDQLAGTIEKGKLANLVITTDSLFKNESEVKQVFVDGYIFNYETNKKSKGNDEKATDITGTWSYNTETPQGSSTGEMTIKKESEGYSGTITFDNPAGGGTKTADMSGIKQSGTSFEFQFNVDVQGMALSVTVSGDFSEDNYQGKMSITDFGSFPFTATKTPDSNTNN